MFFSIARRTLVGAAVIAFASDLPAQPAKRPLADAALEKALAEPLTARFDDQELGQLLATLGSERRVAFLLDRRVDPTKHVSWRTEGEPFLNAVDDRLSANNLSARAVGGTVLVGPEQPLHKIRTVLALRMEELRALGNEALKQRFQLLNDHEIEWPEATEPAEVLAKVASLWKLRIEGLDRVPYDLWPAGGLNDVNGVEALSAILIQYDLTFGWDESATTVTIAPLPEKVWIRREHSIPANRRETVRGEIAGILKSIDYTLERDRVIVQASIEEHERVAGMISGRAARCDGSKGQRGSAQAAAVHADGPAGASSRCAGGIAGAGGYRQVRRRSAGPGGY